MDKTNAIFILSIAFLLTPSAFANTPEFSGFARVVAGQTVDSDNTMDKYDNELSLKPDSIIGLQFDYEINPTLSATAQLTGKIDDSTRSGIEWLYLTYMPKPTLQIKVGKLRTSFFSYSDVLDVGYAYHWVKPPGEVYASFLFTNYDGINISYDAIHSASSTKVEGFYGHFNDSLEFEGNVFAPDVNNFSGAVISHEVNQFKFRASYAQADVKLTDPGYIALQQALRQSGNIEAAEKTKFDGLMQYYQLGVNYDSLDYFMRAEWIKLDHEFDIIATASTYYVSAGYIQNQFTYHLTYSNRDDDVQADFPSLVLPPTAEAQALNQIYLSSVQSVIENDQDSWQLGVRWDFKQNLAFKAELKHRNHKNPILKSRDASTMLFALEWVF